MKSSEQHTNNDNTDNVPPIGAVMVSRMVFDENIAPHFVYREKRTQPEDSGWRVFTGLEPEGYTDDADNFAFYHPNTLLDADPTLKDILFQGVGSVYEKDEDDNSWHKVTDFELEDDHMVTHRLTEDWIININNLFERVIEDSGDLLYTTGDKSVRLTIWDDDRTKEELLTYYTDFIQNRDQSDAPTLETFDFSTDTIARLGYLIREDDGTKAYNVIYGFTLNNQETLQVVLYFDDDHDREWALETWKGIRLKDS